MGGGVGGRLRHDRASRVQRDLPGAELFGGEEAGGPVAQRCGRQQHTARHLDRLAALRLARHPYLSTRTHVPPRSVGLTGATLAPRTTVIRAATALSLVVVRVSG